MSANKHGNAPVKASVKRMHRPERLDALLRGQIKYNIFFQRIGVWCF